MELPKNILVATDLSASCDPVLDAARTFAQLGEATVHLLTLDSFEHDPEAP